MWGECKSHSIPLPTPSFGPIFTSGESERKAFPDLVLRKKEEWGRTPSQTYPCLAWIPCI